MSILDKSSRSGDVERYEAIEKVLVSLSKGKEAPMDFYRALFPSGSFGNDLESMKKGDSYGIFGIIPDNEMYKKMKKWIDKKNNNVPIDFKEDYSLNELEQERMMKFYIYGDLVIEYLQSLGQSCDPNKLRTLTKKEFEKDLGTIEHDGFGEFREVPNIQYPKKVQLSQNASRSAQQKYRLSYELQCARAEYAYDIRYEKLDAIFGARCYRNITQIDDKYTSYSRIQAGWMYNQRVDDSLRQIGMCQGQQSCLIAPADYYGRSTKRSNFGRLYAIALDIDDMRPEKLEETFKYDFFGFKPTYIVQSGTGMHFYYLLAEPLSMTLSYQPKVAQLKMALAKYFVNSDVSFSRTKPDAQRWDEQFRVVGSKSKVTGKFVNAYLVGDLWNIEDLVHLVNRGRPSEKLGEFADWTVHGKTGMTRAEWLQKQQEIAEDRAKKDGISLDVSSRVDRPLGLKGSGFITRNGGFYNSWVERMMDDDSLGSRFHRTCILYADAAYCRIPFSEVDDFAMAELYNYYNQPQVAKGNPFLKSDIRQASKFYNNAQRHKSFSIDTIENLTGVRLPITKRNGNIQTVHCAMMRATKNVKVNMGLTKDTRFGAEGGNDPTLGGRKIGSKDSKPRNRTADSKEQVIRAYLQDHPDAKKVEVIRETGLSKPTVYKWYDKIKAEGK